MRGVFENCTWTESASCGVKSFWALFRSWTPPLGYHLNFLNLEGISLKPHRGFGNFGRNFVCFFALKNSIFNYFYPKMAVFGRIQTWKFRPKIPKPWWGFKLIPSRFKKFNWYPGGGVKERESAQNHLNWIFWYILVVRRFCGQKGDF